MNASVVRNRRTSGELVSLSERHGYLRAMRFGMAVVVLGAGALAPRVRGTGLLTLATVTGIYLLVAAAPDFTRRLRRSRVIRPYRIPKADVPKRPAPGVDAGRSTFVKCSGRAGGAARGKAAVSMSWRSHALRLV